MKDQTIVRLHANVTVNSKDWDAFKQMVAEVKVIVQAEGAENVLVHQTYHQPDSFNCSIIEAYANEKAFLNHLEQIKPLSDKYHIDWSVNRLELSGVYSEEMVAIMKGASRGGDFTVYNVCL